VGEAALVSAGPGLPFAVEEHRLEVVRVDLFEGSPHLLVLGDAGCGKSSLLRLIANGLAARHPPDEVALLVVDLRRGLLDLTALPNLIGYACSTTTVAQAVDHLRRQLEERAADKLDLPALPPTGAWAADRAGPPVPAELVGGLAPAGLAVPDDLGSLIVAPPVGPGGSGTGGARPGRGMSCWSTTTTSCRPRAGVRFCRCWTSSGWGASWGSIWCWPGGLPGLLGRRSSRSSSGFGSLGGRGW
jgi:hypothetical protein